MFPRSVPDDGILEKSRELFKCDLGIFSITIIRAGFGLRRRATELFYGKQRECVD